MKVYLVPSIMPELFRSLPLMVMPLAPVAVMTAITELRSEDAGVRLRAAFGILDRAGIETAPKVSGDAVIRLAWGEVGETSDNNSLLDGG